MILDLTPGEVLALSAYLRGDWDECDWEFKALAETQRKVEAARREYADTVIDGLLADLEQMR